MFLMMTLSNRVLENCNGHLKNIYIYFLLSKQVCFEQKAVEHGVFVGLGSQTCMDEDDSQPLQRLPIDVIQLLQRIQSRAPIPLKTGHISSNNNNDNNATLCCKKEKKINVD